MNTPGRNASAVAEFTIGAILAETRLVRSRHEPLRARDWRGELYRADRTGRELGEMTVDVVGSGAIGAPVVKLLKAFGCQVLVANPYVQLSAHDRNDGVKHVALPDLLGRADMISLNAGVSLETTGFVDREARAGQRGHIAYQCRPGALVECNALYERLSSGGLAAPCSTPSRSSRCHGIGRCCSCRMLR